jgi:Tfp pilus assembly protein PilF
MTTLLRKIAFLSAFLCALSARAQSPADGMVAMQLEDWDKAISVYSALAKSNPADQVALLTLANAYLAKGDQAAADRTIDAAFNAKPDGAYALIANGRKALLKNDLAEADNQFKKATKVAKKDMNALRLIGESYFFHTAPGSKRPNLTRAEELLKAALDVNGKDFATLMSLGYCYKEMPNGGLSAQNYEYAEAIEPKNALAKLMLAKVYKAAKLPEKFESNVDRAIETAPNFTPALRAKAEHFYFGRKWEKATQAYKDLVSNGAEVKIEDEMQLANCLFITHDCIGCSQLVEKILSKDPSKNYLRRLQAYCDYDNGEYARSLNILNDYFKTAPADKIIARDYEYLGRLQMKTKGDTAVALGNLKKSIEMDTMTWPLYKEIAATYRAKKMLCEAANAYKMYFDSIPNPKPTDGQDYYWYGYAQYFCKDDSLRYEKAEQSFKKVTELIPKAGIGWLWAGKAASKKDPSSDQITANPELAKEYGKARTYWEQYVERAWPEKDKNKRDLVDVTRYLAYCYFVENNADKFNDMSGKWLEVDPANEAVIMDMKNNFGKDVPAPGTPATTPIGTPVNGGGGRN